MDTATASHSLQDLSREASKFRGNTYNYPVGWEPTPASERLRILETTFLLDPRGVQERIDTFEAVDNRGAWSGDERFVQTISDGVFVSPKITSLARDNGFDDPFGADYGNLCAAVLQQANSMGTAGVRLALSNRFDKKLEGALTPDLFRMKPEARTLWAQIEEDTPGDYLVRRFNSGSVFNLLGPGQGYEEIVKHGLAPFTLFHIAVLLLTMPERLKEPKHLWLMSAADEYNYSAAPDEWDGSLVARMGEIGGRVVTDVWKGDLREYYGFPCFL
jgi:hypothetical protein